MSPFELMNTIDKEISSYTPKLSAAINKALLYYGEGSSLVGLEYGKNANDAISFNESERIRIKPDESPLVMLKVTTAANLLNENSSWSLIVDTRPADKNGNMEFRYTLIRNRNM
jgi:hypothetical protein